MSHCSSDWAYWSFSAPIPKCRSRNRWVKPSACTLILATARREVLVNLLSAAGSGGVGAGWPSGRSRIQIVVVLLPITPLGPITRVRSLLSLTLAVDKVNAILSRAIALPFSRGHCRSRCCWVYPPARIGCRVRPGRRLGSRGKCSRPHRAPPGLTY